MIPGNKRYPKNIEAPPHETNGFGEAPQDELPLPFAIFVLFAVKNHFPTAKIADNVRSCEIAKSSAPEVIAPQRHRTKPMVWRSSPGWVVSSFAIFVLFAVKNQDLTAKIAEIAKSSAMR